MLSTQKCANYRIEKQIHVLLELRRTQPPPELFYYRERMRGDRMSRDFIEALFRKYYTSLKMYATAVLDDPIQAEDVVQEVFRIACTKDVQKELEIEAPWPWLKKILQNVMSNHRRAENKRETHEVSMETLPEYALISDSDPVTLRTKYQGLISERDLDLVIYMSTNRATYQDAAEKFGIISAEACRKRVKRAIDKIRRKLK